MFGRLLSALLLALACHALIFQISLPARRPPLLGSAQTITLQLTAAPSPTVAGDKADSAVLAEPLPPPPEELPPAELPAVVPQAAPPPEPLAPPLSEAEPAPQHLRADAQVKRLLPDPPEQPVPDPQPAPQPARPDPQPVEQLPSARPAAAREMPAEKPSAPAIIKARPAYRINPKPVYPELARRRNWQGTVSLAVTVERDGRPGQVDIATSSGYTLLDKAALQAVRSWRFHPGSENGRPVTMTVLLPITFRLE